MERCKSKKYQLEKLSEIEKLKLKRSRPLPDVSSAKNKVEMVQFFILILIKHCLFCN